MGADRPEFLARNDCIPIYVNYPTDSGQAIGVHGLRIIGNVVHTDTIHNGGDRCDQAISLGNNDQSDTIVAFNSLEGPVRRSNSTRVDQGHPDCRQRYGSRSTAAREVTPPAAVPGTTGHYNVLTDGVAASCGASNARSGSPFASKDAQPNSPSGSNKYFSRSTRPIRPQASH